MCAREFELLTPLSAVHWLTYFANHATGNVDLAYIWMATNYIGT